MLSASELKTLFDLDELTGILSWKVRPSASARADLTAGYFHKASGYFKVTCRQRVYPVHRVVWALIHGEWPLDQIDHINGDRSDNRPENLRDVTNSENRKNCGLYRRNKSGVSGVRWRENRSRWEVSIRDKGSLKYLGLFRDFDEAVEVRREAQAKLNFHPNHGQRAA